MAAQIVKTEFCKSWEKSGKREFLTICKNEVSDSDLGAASTVLQRALYDVCWHVLRGVLSKDQAVAAFLDIADLSDDIPSLIADVLSIIGNT